MNQSHRPYWRNYWIGLAGFCLGGIIGAFSTYLIFASGVMDVIAGFISPGQPYVRFLFGIVLAFIGISLGGAIDGLVCGYTLHLIDPIMIRRRYLLGGAFSTGASQGILVIPIILFISLLSIYNVGSQADPASFILVFALVGGLFGFVNGGILSFCTLRIRYVWIAWLAYFSACVIGGALFGLIIWRPAWLSAVVTGGYATPLFLVLAGSLIYGFAGGMMGLVFTWLSRKRNSSPDISLSPRLWQDISTVILSTVIFLMTIVLINRLATFVTIYQGSVTTSLSSGTEGVHWLENKQVTTDILPEEVPVLGLSARANLLALTWSNGTGEILLSTIQSSQGVTPAWSNPLNVSISPADRSTHPQTVLDTYGRAHVVWSEDGLIWYNQCDDQSCGAPVKLSTINTTCGTPTYNTLDDWPAIAIDQNGMTMVAWDAGEGSTGFTSWETTENVDQRFSGCLESTLVSTRPRLAAGEPGEFWLAISGASYSSGKVSLVNYSQHRWAPLSEIGEGSTTEILITPEGKINTAWCGNNQELHYLAMGDAIKTVPSAKCLNRPSMFTDAAGHLHLVFATNQWEDNFGNVRIGRMLMESVLLPDGWSEPTITAPLSAQVQQEVTASLGMYAQLAWIDRKDEKQILLHTTQPEYRCQEEVLSYPMKVVLGVIKNGNYHPADYQPPFCGNHYEELVFLPNPFPEFAVLPAGEKDGFDQIADLMKSAEYEVLFSNMQWDEDVDNLSPGSRIAGAISNMYQKLRANPEAYPRGLTIKILLGNYPNLSTLQMGDQIWNVLQDITDMGNVPMHDPDIGWKVELANYKGTFPHSHTKFIVVDGKTMMAGGFNIAWVHLPKNDISGKGDDMTDLGITISGPIAQTGIEVFDEMWQGANQLVCIDPLPASLGRLQNTCTWETATVSHIPDSLKYYLPGDTDTALGLYRSADYKESDEAMHVVLQSAEDSIDILHANFTAELICDVNMVFPGVCNYDNTLPFMRSLVSAMENNGVKVRVLVEETNMNGMENRVGLRILQDELARRGLADQLEVRLFDGRLHTKSVLIDNRLLIIGSQNFHYSSIAEGGLNEFNLAIDSPEALADYQRMFDYYWQHATPSSLLQPGGFTLDW